MKKYKLNRNLGDWRKGDWVSLGDFFERKGRSRTTIEMILPLKDYDSSPNLEVYFDEEAEYCAICNKYKIGKTILPCKCPYDKDTSVVSWPKVKNYLQRLCWKEEDIKSFYDAVAHSLSNTP